MQDAILFRVDGGKIWGVSLGHLKRSLLLAKALSDECRIIFIIKSYPEGVNYVHDSGMEQEVIRIDDDSDETLINFCEKYSPCKIIFDLYVNPYSSLFEYAHSKGVQTVAFDVLGRISGQPDILINDSIRANEISYPRWDKRTKFYLGPQYFLMDHPSKVMSLRNAVRDIMVTMGGSDPEGLTLKILNSLLENHLNSDVNMCVVLGPFFRQDKEVHKLTKPYPTVKIYKNPYNFSQLLSVQDVVICAGGHTLSECGAFGRPVIIVPSIEHEARNSAKYAELTRCFDIGLWEDGISPGKIITALEEYKNNYKLRESIFRTSRVIFDGNGLNRILTAIKDTKGTIDIKRN